MKVTRWIIWVLFLLFCYSMKAQQDIRIRSNGTMLPQEYLYLVGGSLNVENHNGMTRFVLADSSYIDLYYYPQGDSVLLVRTQCAPLCASFARIYDEQWNLLHDMPAPRTMILPEAYVEEGEIRWRDNYRDDEAPK